MNFQEYDRYEAANYLNTCPKAISNLVTKKKIKPCRIGPDSMQIFSRSELDKVKRMPVYEDSLPISKLSKEIGCSTQSLRNRVNDGRLKAIQDLPIVKDGVLIARTEADRFIKEYYPHILDKLPEGE